MLCQPRGCAGGAPPPAVPLSFVGLALATMGASFVWSFFAQQPLALLHAFVVGVFLTTASDCLSRSWCSWTRRRAGSHTTRALRNRRVLRHVDRRHYVSAVTHARARRSEAHVAPWAICIGAVTLASALLCAVWFFIGTAIVGYLQRIVPFIWWIRRAKAEGAKNIPTLGQMNDSLLGYLILAAWLAAGLVRVADPSGLAAPTLALLAWGLLMAQLLRIFTLGRPCVVSSAP